MKTELFIDGAWRPATGGATFAVIDPLSLIHISEPTRPY